METETSLISQSVMAARGAGLTLDEFRRVASLEFIIATLAANKWNQCRSAKELGMHRNTLSRTCDTLGIDIRAMRERKKVPQSTRREANGKRQAG